MADLSSSSTLNDAINLYNNSAAWWESEAKAKQHLEAVVWLIGNRPLFSSERGTSFNFQDLLKIRKELVAYLGLDGNSDNQVRFLKARTP